jgi:hypothetical protein
MLEVKYLKKDLFNRIKITYITIYIVIIDNKVMFK